MLNNDEIKRLFKLINRKYPFNFIKSILDLIYFNLAKNDSKVDLSDLEKTEIMNNIICPFFKQTAPLSKYVVENPYKAEYYEVVKKTHHISKKEDRIVRNYIKFNKNIELTEEIRIVLLKIIAILDQKKFIEYLLDDIDSYVPYTTKFERADKEFKIKLEEIKLKRNCPNTLWIYIPNYTKEDELNNLYNKKEGCYLELNTLSELIKSCYYPETANIFKQSKFEQTYRDLASKYLDNEEVMRLISLINR